MIKVRRKNLTNLKTYCCSYYRFSVLFFFLFFSFLSLSNVMCDPSSQYTTPPTHGNRIETHISKVAYNFYFYKYIYRNCAHR